MSRPDRLPEAIMGKPPLPVWDRQQLVQEWMDDHQPHYESDPQRSFTHWIKSQPLYDQLYAVYENSRWSTRDDAVISHQSLELLAGVLGGSKRSSQHLEGGGCDEYSKATVGSVWTGAIAVTRSTVASGTRCATTVLGGDRGRDGKRGSCGSRVAGCRNEMVPRGRGHATSDVWPFGKAALRTISLVG